MAIKSYKAWRALFLSGFPLGLAGVRMLAAHAGSAERLAAWIPLRCPLHMLTGFRCPTCGLMRSLIASAQGNFFAAVHFHFLGPVLLAMLALFWLGWLVDSKFPERLRRVSVPRPAVTFALLAYLAWGLQRNLLP